MTAYCNNLCVQSYDMVMTRLARVTDLTSRPLHSAYSGCSSLQSSQMCHFSQLSCAVDCVVGCSLTAQILSAAQIWTELFVSSWHQLTRLSISRWRCWCLNTMLVSTCWSRSRMVGEFDAQQTSIQKQFKLSRLRPPTDGDQLLSWNDTLAWCL